MFFHYASRFGAVILVLFAAPVALGQPAFSKSFSPSTIGPGSESTLTFTITNAAASPVSDLNFFDALPAGVTIANPTVTSSTCGGDLFANAGSSFLSFNGGSVAGGSACTISVDVTSSTPGTHTNVSGDLTSSAGNSGSATADLTVSTSVPGFRKSFSPATVPFGQRTTLTFTIDNSANGSLVFSLNFSDTLPGGLVVASPSNVTNTCSGAVTATAGSSTISFSSGFVAANSTCTISVDVLAGAGGTLVNSSGSLNSGAGTSGKANAALTVTTTDLILTKSFTDDPVAPGGTATLQFTILNRSRTDTATGLTFTDDLDAALSGLVATSLPSDPCGTGSSISGTSTLTFSGGSLAPEGTCTFAVTLQVPAGAAPGNYTNTTSQISGDLGGSATTGTAASSDLFVQPGPMLTKMFTDDPAIAGGTVTAEFTITNTSTADPANSINFTDNLTAFATGTTINTLPANGFCGGAATAFGTTDGFGSVMLNVSNASLAAGASCTFQVVLNLDAGLQPGIYTNTTSAISASVGGATYFGDPATDTATVLGAPDLAKTFTDDPVDPGAAATLEFTLTYNQNATADAMGIGFTDDLDAALAGLVATSLPADGFCGPGSTITGTSLLTISNASLAPGGTCTFAVTVQVPPGAVPGSYTNTTSTLSATVSGNAVTGDAASDALDINGITLAKAFIDDPAVAGGTTTLRFTLSNAHPTDDATSISFTDDLDAVLTGLAATGLPTNDVCGAGSQLSGTSMLTLTGGSLTAGSSCTFDVTLQLPAGAAPGEYVNTTSTVSATQGGNPVTAPAATDRLVVGAPLSATKNFLDDPVAANETVTLRFILTNSSPSTDVTAVSFTDDLDAVLSGLVATSLPATGFCGAGSSVSGTSVLNVSGVTVPAASSCTFDVTLTTPSSAIAGVYPNQTSTISGMVSGTAIQAAEATDDLVISQAVAIMKSFTDDPTERGGTATLELTLTNPHPSSSATGVTFTDDLDAVIPGLVAVNVPQSDVCGTGSTLSGTSVLTLTGGTIPANGSCTFDVLVQVPAAAPLGTFTNTTSGVTATIAGRSETGFPDSDNLVVVDAPVLTKLFPDDSVEAGDSVTVDFTLTLDASAPDATAITFTDDLDAALPGLVATGLPRSNVCGAGSTLSGTSVITLSGGMLSAGGSCTFSVTLQVPGAAAAGAHANVTSDVSATMLGTPVGSAAASDDLFIVVAPTLTKTFTDDPIEPGDTVTLQFDLTLDAAAPAGATAIGFTDDLGAALAGLVATGLPLNDVCGPGSQLSGTSVLSLTGGSLAAGASCTFSVTLQVPAGATPGTHTNTTSTVSATMLGTPVTGSAASDDLVVIVAPVLTKSFTDDPVEPGDPVTLEFTLTLDASAPASATGITFTDDLDATLAGLAATGLPANDVCGAGSQLSGTSTLTLTGGTLAPGGSCTFGVTLQTPATAPAGNYPNTTSAVAATMSGQPVTGAAATDTLIINGLILTKSFTDDPAIPGGNVTLEFTLTNGNPAASATNVTFTDDLDAAASGLVATGLPMADVCGAGSQLSGTSVLTLTGGTLAGGSSCTFSVTLQVDGATAPGTYTNVTSSVNADIGGFPATSAPAQDLLEVVTPLDITKSFTDDPVTAGGTVTLELTLTNSSPTADVTNATFTDDLDAVVAGLVASGLPASDVCGTGSQLTGTSVLTLSGGTIPATGSCTFSVTLQVPSTPGTFTNTTSVLSGEIGGTTIASLAGATDMLTVGIAPVLTKTFLGDPVEAGDTVTLELTLTLDAAAPAGATAISFTDDLDATLAGLVATGLPANDVCGAGSQLAGTGVLTFNGGSLAPGASCTFQATLQVPAAAPPGIYTNVTSDVTATMAGAPVTGSGATDDLQVAAVPGLTKLFLDDPAVPGGTVTLEFTITNPNPSASLTDLTFTDDLSAVLPGLVATGLPATDVCGAGSTLSGTSTLTLSGGNLAPGGTCTFVVTLALPTGISPGPIANNVTSTITGTVAGAPFTGPAASDDLLVDLVLLAKAFTGEASPGRTVQLTFTLTNPDSTSAVSGIGFTDDLDAVLPGLMAVGTPLVNICGPSSSLTGTSVITVSNASLAAGASCSFTVDVMIPEDAPEGTVVNVTSQATAGGFRIGSAATGNLAVAPAAAAASIPTLGTWMLLLMATLLAAAALWKI